MSQLIAYSIFLTASLLALFSPSTAMALVLVMYAAEQLVQAAGGVFLSIPPLANIMIALIGGFAAVRVALATPRPFLGYANAQWFCTLLIYGWSIITLVWTASPETATDIVRKGLPYFVLFVIVAPMLIRDVEDMRRTIWALLLIGVVTAVGLVTNPEVRSSSGRLGVMLSATVRTSPLAIGDLGGLLIIVGALSVAAGRNGLFMLFRTSGILLGLALALMSGSRGQVLFGVLLSIALFPIARSVRNIRSFLAVGVGAIVLGVAIYFIVPLVLDRFGINRWDAGNLEEGASIRVQNAMVLIEAQGRNPISYISGLGFNAFAALTPSGTEPYSHNVPLDIFSELGLGAFAIFITILWRAVSDSVWLVRTFASHPIYRSTVATTIAMSCFYFLICLKQGNLWSTMPLFMMLAIMRRIRIRTEAEQSWFEDEASGHEDDPEMDEPQAVLVRPAADAVH